MPGRKDIRVVVLEYLAIAKPLADWQQLLGSQLCSDCHLNMIPCYSTFSISFHQWFQPDPLVTLKVFYHLMEYLKCELKF